MAIMNVIEYQEEGVVIIEDHYGKYVVTEDSDAFISLDVPYQRLFESPERDRMLT